MASTAAGSAPYSADQVVRARSTDSSEVTKVPSMSNNTARSSRNSICPPLNSFYEHKIEGCHGRKRKRVESSPRPVADGRGRARPGGSPAGHHPRCRGARTATEHKLGDGGHCATPGAGTTHRDAGAEPGPWTSDDRA